LGVLNDPFHAHHILLITNDGFLACLSLVFAREVADTLTGTVEEAVEEADPDDTDTTD
jgi:hypothetical protein